MPESSKIQAIARLLQGRASEIQPNGHGYNTPLQPMEEMAFRQWQKQSGIAFDPDAPITDYDLRGYWKGLQQGNPNAAAGQINQYDGKPHLTDYYKTPLHESFSNESQWASPNAPRWAPDGSYLEDKSGRIRYRS